MRKANAVRLVIAMTMMALAGCASLRSAEHKYIMKGQVLEVNDGQVVLCIGKADGATAGQEFQVYRYKRTPYVSPKQTAQRFKREEVGSVRITQVVDVHYAEASVVSGDVQVHDVAELGW